MRPPSSLALAILVAALVASAAPARAATWFESYHEAESALAERHWGEAVRHLNAALAERPGSGASVRTYGMRFIEYFPYLELGVAYAELGQDEAALQAFETELRQGEVAKSPVAAARLREARERVERRRTDAESERRRRAPAVVGERLAAAAELERAGRFEDALAAVAGALAVEPGHPEASAAHRRLLAAATAELRRRESEGAAAAAAAPSPRTPGSVSPSPAGAPAGPAGALGGGFASGAPEEVGVGDAARIGELLAGAEGELTAGEPERALRAAHRVLMLEPSNAAALRLITRAYTRLSDALLAPDRTAPAIVLDEAPADGAPLVVRAAQATLAGTVYDRGPVEISVLSEGRPVGRATAAGRELQGVWITDFRWRHRLPAGRSSVELVAVDRAGNRATLTVALLYDVPLVRTTAFAVALSGGLLLVAAGGLAARARSRRRRLRGRFNPYVAGAPILEPTRFYGRRELLEYVLRRVPNNSLLLYGERRIGKTSFQHELKRCLAKLDDPVHEFFPVFIDLQGTPQERFFGTLAAEIFHELAPKLGGIQPSAPTGVDGYGYAELHRDVQRVLQALRERSRKKVKLVLLIDEVDELNDYDPRVNQRLRSLFMRAFADNLVAVVSGVSIRKHWEREGSPWYNFFQEVEMKPLDPDEARSLIETPVRGTFRFESGVADEIVRRTGSKPYLIQRLCCGLVDRLHQERRRSITRDDLEAACRVEGI